jgi:hypothetical protein
MILILDFSLRNSLPKQIDLNYQYYFNNCCIFSLKENINLITSFLEKMNKHLRENPNDPRNNILNILQQSMEKSLKF